MFSAGFVLPLMYLEMAVHIGHWHFKDPISRTKLYSHVSVNSEQ